MSKYHVLNSKLTFENCWSEELALSLYLIGFKQYSMFDLGG